MLRFAICDDDIIIINELDELLHRYMTRRKQVFDVQYFTSGAALLKAAGQAPFHVILLDVGMDEINGIDTAKRLRAKGQKQTVVIFVTALEQYMQDAFDVRAFHYLIKPVQTARFFEVLQAAIDEVAFLSGNDAPFMMVTSGGISHKIPFGDIFYIDYYNKKATVHTGGRDIVFYDSMRNMEGELNDSFFRCHRSIIVGLRHIAEYDASNVRLTNGITLPVARPQYHNFVIAMLRYIQRGGEVNA